MAPFACRSRQSVRSNTRHKRCARQSRERTARSPCHSEPSLAPDGRAQAAQLRDGPVATASDPGTFMAQVDVLTPAGEVPPVKGHSRIHCHPAHRTTHGQTYTNTLDQPNTLTVAESHSLHRI